MYLSKQQREEIYKSFMAELDLLLKNTLDPRADPLAKRWINLKLIIKPLGDGKNYDVFPQITSKKCPIQAGQFETKIKRMSNGMFSLFSVDEEEQVSTEKFELFPEFEDKDD